MNYRPGRAREGRDLELSPFFGCGPGPRSQRFDERGGLRLGAAQFEGRGDGGLESRGPVGGSGVKPDDLEFGLDDLVASFDALGEVRALRGRGDGAGDGSEPRVCRFGLVDGGEVLDLLVGHGVVLGYDPIPPRSGQVLRSGACSRCGRWAASA